MACDNLFGLVSTSDVEHGIQAAVVQRCTSNSHGASLTLASWITGRVPRDVTEEGTTREHPVKPAYQV